MQINYNFEPTQLALHIFQARKNQIDHESC